MRTLPLLLAAAACTGDDTPDTPPYQPPSGAPTSAYAPSDRLTTWPDLLHTTPDATTPTGHRVQLNDAARSQLGGLLPEGFTLVPALEQLDGFGTTAGVTLSFTREIDPAAFLAATRFVAVTDGADVPFEVWWTDGGNTAVVEPLFPLAPERTYAVIVSSDLVDATGADVWRSADLDRAMAGTLPDAPDVLGAAWADALAVTGLSRDDVAHGTVFTTQSIGAQDEAVATLLRDAGPTLTRVGDCVTEGPTTRCEATLTAVDVLGDDGTIAADEVPASLGTYALPATLWLPGDGTGGPWPVVIYGHGLGGDRYEARGDADHLADEGFVVVSIDAPRHGDHPRASGDDTLGDLQWILEFFGVSITEQTMDVLVLRDDFRLSTWEKLQLTEALRAGFDADGDGTGDVDATTLGYAGHSLGGLMGVQLVAMDPGVGSAYLSVPGGRVSGIVHRGQIFAPLVSLMAPAGTPPGEVDRFFPLLQTAIERADPLNWAGRVLDGERDVLVQQVIADDIMPNETTRALARALGVSHVGPDLQAVAGLPHDATSFPLSGNVGGRTAALFQYDDFVDGGERVTASHTDIFGSDSNVDQLRHWFRTWREDGTAELIDPLAE